jgi:hypothetical protein
MILHSPFVITGRLTPGLQLAEGVFLSLLGTQPSKDSLRMGASLVLDFPDGRSHEDSGLQSGCGGFGGTVSIFETYLSFLGAALESFDYERRTGDEGENTDLFPRWVLEALEGQGDEIACIRGDLCVDPGSDMPNESLIEE